MATMSDGPRESLPGPLPNKPRPIHAQPLGLPPLQVLPHLQQDVAKELVNKLAWVLGSTYRVPYSNIRTGARAYAWRIAKAVLQDHGYPSKIAKE